MQLKPQPAARARWAGAANFDYAEEHRGGRLLIQRASSETMREGLPGHGAPKRIPDARRGGSKTSCNPKPTDHFPGTVQNLPTRSRKAVTEVRAAQNEGGS